MAGAIPILVDEAKGLCSVAMRAPRRAAGITERGPDRHPCLHQDMDISFTILAALLT